MTKPRYLKILRMRKEQKLTFAKIGEKLGITRQRVWELYRRAERQTA